MSEKMSAIDPLRSFEHLPAEISAKLRAAMRVSNYAPGEHVFCQGDDAQAVYLVVQGRVKIVRVTPEGYESILCVRGPGEYFCPVPLLDQGEQLGSAVAMTSLSLFVLPREDFHQLCQQSLELLSVVQADCLSEVRYLLHRLEAFAFRRVRERVAIALLDQRRAQKNSSGEENIIPLTQAELAALVGAARESVSRVLKSLETDGLLAIKRGRIRILDPQRLRRIAEGNK